MENKVDIASVRLDDVTFGYNKRRLLLDQVNLCIDKGTIVGIVGPSGSGKTTLLRLINGSLHGDYHKKIKGSIWLSGKEMKKEEDFFRKVGSVYQNPDNQIIFSNVEDELAFGMENLSIHPRIIEDKIKQVLELLGISHLKERNPNNLSGGEKQLVILGAILCLDTDIIILDESMAQVDEEGRDLISKAIMRLKAKGKTIIMVEHEYRNLAIADCVYRLSQHKLDLVDKGSLRVHGIH